MTFASARLPVCVSLLVVALGPACRGDAPADSGTDGSETGTGDGDPGDGDGDSGDGDGDPGDGDGDGDPPPLVEPGDPGPGDVTFEIRADTDVRPISPLIYGINGGDDLDGAQKGATLLRSGGNRMTAYNWENNASNAGSDYFHQNDAFLVGDLPINEQDEPGAAVRGLVEASLAHDAAAMLTIPICGYVAADKDGGGDVNQSPNYLETRFHPTIALKGAPLSAVPDLDDDAVFQDEFVHWVVSNFPAAFESSPSRVLFSMDNEPDLWSFTHARIHPEPLLYAELVAKNIEFARAVKSVAPDAWVTGFVSYGFNGYINLQSAPDEQGEFIPYFLSAMAEAEQIEGQRLIDVLDLHWYPEALGNGQRITGEDVSPESIEARIQAPRSLWDSNYVEDSWIAEYFGGAIALLPWVQARIDENYPGTGLGFTEYNYGAASHISGAIAEADVLGIFGREGVALATFWPLVEDNSMVYAALRAYRSYDGEDGRFGDTSVHAGNSDVAAASVYASIDADGPARMVIVAINKTTNPLDAAITMAAYGDYGSVDVWQLTDAGPVLSPSESVDVVDTNALVYSMPPLSVSVLVPVE
jgi:hypothetical protein